MMLGWWVEWRRWLSFTTHTSHTPHVPVVSVSDVVDMDGSCSLALAQNDCMYYAVSARIYMLTLVIISITRYRDIDRGFVKPTISWRPYIVRYRARTHVSRVRCSHTAAAASASD